MQIKQRCQDKKLDNKRQMLKMLWAAHKQKTHTKKSRHIKHKKLRTSGFVVNPIHIQIMKSAAGLWGLGMGLEKRRVITNPWIMSKMFSWHLHNNIITSTGLFQMNSCGIGGGDTAVRTGWSWWTWPTSAAELAPHIPTGSCNRKTWCLSDYGPEWPITMAGKEPGVDL